MHATLHASNRHGLCLCFQRLAELLGYGFVSVDNMKCEDGQKALGVADIDRELELRQASMSDRSQSGVVLDGFPQTLEQAVAMQGSTWKVVAAVFLDCREEVMRTRMGHAGENSESLDDVNDKLFLAFAKNHLPILDFLEVRRRAL